MTHFIPYDAPPLGRHARALCGALVERRAHASEPECPTCRQTLVEDEASLDALRDGDQ